MKITKSQLKQLIKEEIEAVDETDWTRVKGLGANPSSHPDKQEIVQKCWHETKHLEQGEFVTAFNACMKEALLPMAEGHGDAGMYQLGPAQMLDSALVLLDNEPDARDIEDAIAILVKLQAHIS